MLSLESLRNENNRFSEKLNKENRDIYTDIVCYLRVSYLTDVQQEEIISDILSMFFDWEKQGKKVKDMIGEDYKKFADDIINAVNPHKSILEKSKEYLFIILEAFCYMFTIDFLFLLPKIIKGNLHLMYDYSLDMALRSLLILIVAVSVINYIGRNSFSLRKKAISKPTRFLIGCCVGGFFIISAFLPKALSHIIFLSINIRYVIAITVVFWIYKAIRRILLNYCT
ncbi:DUF1048 domain-containing protein [Ruminiclostridium cellulolyticum]|uniref:DUF1048 domain-containing protein n=1 Tax=Ruminiclostridium cellulolyticum (strain ATCC 35319 / DSM 5812 / JCM 6584 / H10) TaxID=394503 RepID=B8I524_RUMCH|nr:DUF1048 domain-containing protein [Ruminiclostridium cellulolyticum]ACL74604.1 conserved hypothetical protein [Ruminiclostridium cellulolyticum H10]